MDWKTFIAEIVKSIAWPIVGGILIYQLKDRIAELLPRLKKLKHKDTEFEFAEKLQELAVHSTENNKTTPKPEKTPEGVEQFKFLMQLSEISPRSAVVESFRVLENSSAKALAKAYPELVENRFINQNESLKMLSGKILNENQINRFNELRQLRNKAAHMEDFELQNMPIEAYIDIALTLADYLDNYKP